MPEYQIDYDHPDVDDLMRQIRAHASAQAADPLSPASAPDVAQERLRGYLQLDDEQPYELERQLAIDPGWNVVPEDLRASHPGVTGTIIRGVRTLARPLTKVLANTDLPIFKQFKLNLGFAAAILDLLEDNARLRQRVDALAARLDKLEADGTGREPR